MNRHRQLLTFCAVLASAPLLGACGSSAPSTSGGGDSTLAQAQKTERFSACMRSHGVGNFPDLSPSQMTIDAVANGSGVDTNTPAFTQALSACRHLEPSGFVGPGKRSPLQMSAAFRFARCIRANGVKDFPDPVNGQPLIDTNRIPSTSTPAGMSILNAAMRTCHTLGAAAIGQQS